MKNFSKSILQKKLIYKNCAFIKMYELITIPVSYKNWVLVIFIIHSIQLDFNAHSNAHSATNTEGCYAFFLPSAFQSIE